MRWGWGDRPGSSPPCPSSLQGVPVAYDNIKVVGELGDIYDDQGFIHLNIEADFIIFSPKKGKKLVVCECLGVSRDRRFLLSGQSLAYFQHQVVWAS